MFFLSISCEYILYQIHDIIDECQYICEYIYKKYISR